MRTQHIVDLLLVAALTGPASAILGTDIFRKEEVLANLVYPDYLVLSSTAYTVLDCGQICLREKSCTSFTYIGSVHSPGTCHGYFRSDLQNANTKLAVGASTYVMQSVQCDVCTNVAVNKPATQHSTSHDGDPNRAVDNNYDTTYRHGYCSHTSAFKTSGQTHWWQVDLQDSYDIFFVIITNRGDIPLERLRDFDISVHNEDPVTQPGATSTLCYQYDGAMGIGSTKQFNCYRNPIRGQIVRITNHPELILTLCEVQVMAIPAQ